MVILTGASRLIGHEPKNKLGFSQDYGQALFGYCEFGADNPYAGVYRKYTNDKKNYLIKMVHYPTPYHNTANDIAVRTSFANAITAWRALSADSKREYDVWGRKYKMSGYNKYISEYRKGNVT